MERKIEEEKILKTSSESNYEEILELLEESKAGIGTSLTFDFEKNDFKEVDELKEMINRAVEDPEEKYNLFYNGIQRLINKYIPDKNIRKIVNGEKLVFLRRGKVVDKRGIAGADSRMTYNEDMARVVEIISEWVIDSLDPTDLYKRFYALNEEYGYPHQRF